MTFSSSGSSDVHNDKLPTKRHLQGIISSCKLSFVQGEWLLAGFNFI